MARLDADTAYLHGRIEQYQAALLKAAEDASRADVLAMFEAENKVLTDELARIFARYATQGRIPLEDMQRYARLTKLNALVAQIGHRLGGSTVDFLNTQLPALYEDNAVQLTSALGLDLVAIDPKRVVAVMAYPWSGAEFSERVWDDTAALASRLKQTLIRGFVQGSSFDEMTTELAKHMESGRYVAKRLIRTESMMMMNQSSLDQYVALGCERVQCLETWDERTCDVCMAFDGEEYAINDAPTLPRHPLCRGTYVPVSASDVTTWQSRLIR